MGTFDRWARATMFIIAAVAIAYLLFRLRFVLVTIALGAMLAYALRPLVEGAERVRLGNRRVPHFVAVLAVFLVVALTFVWLTRLAAEPVAVESQSFARNLEQYRDRVGTLLVRTQQGVHQVTPAPLVPVIDHALDQAGLILIGGATNVLRGTARWISHVFEIVLIPILAFYFLLDLPALRDELVAFLPHEARRFTLTAGRRADRIVAGYVRAQIILMVLSGIVVSVGLAVLGVRFSLLLGILAGLTRAIPIIGPVLGAIPIVGIAALQSPNTAGAVLVFFVVLQLVESKVLLPKIVGHELKLHAATILIALLLGNVLFGLTGMFLAPPAAAFAKALREMLEPAVPDVTSAVRPRRTLPI